MRTLGHYPMKYIICLTIVLCGLQHIYSQATLTYTYDSQGRLATEYYESVYKLEFAYDAEGNLADKALTNYTDISITKQIEYQDGIEVFPNPVSNMLTIRTQNKEHLSTVELIDIAGRKITTVTPNVSEIKLNTSALEKGVYMLHIIVDGMHQVTRIIKQ